MKDFKKRYSGVLMSISSLPGGFGIGGFGKECFDFLDFTEKCGFSAWQVLPFNLPDYGNSPYGSCSAFAGNYLYIDPVELMKSGYITEKEMNDCIYSGSPYTVDYEFAFGKKREILKKAYNKAGTKLALTLQKFSVKNEWVEDYALYMVIKEQNSMKPWYEWDTEFKDYNNAKKQINIFYDKMLFYIFEQYIFDMQWSKVKKYADFKKIKIIGDMPVYVANDSVDVWKNPQLFQLNDDFTPKKVAGVPPDAFSSDGQLWGNPIYNWEEHEKDDFKWWISRLKRAFEFYDSVRIDHFRAFASYYAIEYESKTAKNGEWVKGPGRKLFDRIFELFSRDSIIAEDLGNCGDDVIELLKYCKIKGMRVVQFGFSGEDSTHLPHNYSTDSVAYIGTHDNNTLLGWLWEIDDLTRKNVLDYCGFKGDNWGEGGYCSKSCRSIIETVWKSHAAVTIIAFQDICGFGSDARTNIPGVPEKNWRFRTTEETVNSADSKYFNKINMLYFR